MAKKNKLAKISDQRTAAENLFMVQKQIKLLQDQEDEYKSQLLASLKEQHVTSVKLDDGTQFIVTERQTLKVTDEDAAKSWLDDKYCWKPDTSKALQLVRRSLESVPDFFSISTSEYLTVKHA